MMRGSAMEVPDTMLLGCFTAEERNGKLTGLVPLIQRKGVSRRAKDIFHHKGNP